MNAAATALQPQTEAFRSVRRITPAQAGLVLILIAIGVRALGLGMRPLWLDESYSAWCSAQSWNYLWSVVPTFETHPPFYYSLLKVWRAVFGDHVIALRSLSVALGALTVPVIMAAAFEQDRLRPAKRPLVRAGTAGLLVALSPVLVLLGQEARPYPLMIFAYAVAILGLLRLIREFADGGPGSWSSWILFAAGTELTLWAHALGLLYAFCLALALAPSWLRPPLHSSRIQRGALCGAAVAMAYLPCLLMMLDRARDWGTGWLSWRPAMLLQLFELYSIPALTESIPSAVAALAMLVLIIRAVAVALRRRGWNSERALLLLWVGPPILTVLISALGMPVFLLRTLAPTLIPAYLSMGAAIARTRSPNERGILAAAVGLALVPAAFQMALRPASEQWDSVVTYLSRNVSGADRVWLYPNDTALPVAEISPALAAAARPIPANYPAVGVPGPVRAGSPAVVSVTREQAARIASDPALEQVPVIWLVTRQRGIFDPDDDLSLALARVRRPGKMQEWGYIAVQSFYLSNSGVSERRRRAGGFLADAGYAPVAR